MDKLTLCTVLTVVLFFCASLHAQNDSLLLPEITLTDKLILDFSTHQNIKKISNDLKKSMPIGLTNILITESALNFKENGRGMVSSPAFRGTSASQTAIIWNGININSPALGQQDFNLINASDFQNIYVKSGGGSTLYGSGAIGGSIHLNSELNFKNQTKQALTFLGGSFDTYHLNHQLKMGNEKLAFNSSISYNDSKNDYPYIGYDAKNENGQFQNFSLQTNLGYKFNKKSQLRYHVQLFKGNRHFSGTIATIGKSKYHNFDNRQLVDFNYESEKGHSYQSKLAFLTEKFEYFENFNLDKTSDGLFKTLLNRHEYIHHFSTQVKWHLQAEYQYQWAESSNFHEANRHTYTGASALKHEILESFDYEIGLRYEKTNIYDSPILYSFQTKWQPLSFYALRLIHSKNYRVPTFNDLFWPGSGNLNLKPEHSSQFDISNDLMFKNGQLTLTYYQNQIKDMIQWLPNLIGLWQPINEESVHIKGIETKLMIHKKYKNTHATLDFQYSYTDSRNLKNNKQMVYVPLHRLTNQLNLTYGSWSLRYNYLFNGSVFSNAENSNFIKEYGLSNVFLNHHFGKKQLYNVQFQILNIENKAYQTVISRPMPGRYYQFILNIEI